MTNKLEVKPQEFSFYEQARCIVSEVEKLKDEHGVQVVFDKEGMRISALHDKSIRQDYLFTGRELKMYRWGLEDMKAHQSNQIKTQS